MLLDSSCQQAKFNAFTPCGETQNQMFEKMKKMTTDNFTPAYQKFWTFDVQLYFGPLKIKVA